MWKQEEELKAKLGDKIWRLTSGKLYKIKNKKWEVVPFIPNDIQREYYEEKHNLNIIPKARQLGFSTAIDIDYFDDFLFRRNFNVGIIADTLPIANEIFRDKILVAWNNLPERLKGYYKLKTDKTNELTIENTGSRISVGSDYRWWVLQRLHISEFGKICNKYPKKAEEIVTGALQTVATGQGVTIESTAMWAEGYFYEFTKRAKDIQDIGREPNEMEYKLFFYPWWKEKLYRVEWNIVIPQEIEEYFEELDSKHGIETDREQRNRYYMKYADLREKMFQEYPSTFEEAFSMSLKGAYYENELIRCRQQHRVCRVMYEPALQVHTAWDIWGAGGWDDTVIRFFQTYWEEIRLIDYREGNWRSLVEIIETIVKPKGYVRGKHFWPHDLMVTEMSNRVTRYDTALQCGLRFEVLQKTSISEGIDQVRKIFSRCWFDEEKCGKGIENLGKYRRAWDDKNGVFMDRPMKNGADHAADSFRYLAQGIALATTPKEAEITNLEW